MLSFLLVDGAKQCVKNGKIVNILVVVCYQLILGGEFMELIFLCLKIFICRIIDVSLGTVKTIIMVKGKTTLSAIVALAEGLIWFLVVREALLFDTPTLLSKLSIAFAYAIGFAAGTYIGGKIADKFIVGNVNVQIVTSSQNNKMLETIRNAGYAITVLDVNTSLLSKKKYMLFCEVTTKQLDELKALIYSLDKKAFFMVHETKYVYNGFFKK